MTMRDYVCDVTLLSRLATVLRTGRPVADFLAAHRVVYNVKERARARMLAGRELRVGSRQAVIYVNSTR